jgi:hypothetical protein
MVYSRFRFAQAAARRAAQDSKASYTRLTEAHAMSKNVGRGQLRRSVPKLSPASVKIQRGAQHDTQSRLLRPIRIRFITRKLTDRGAPIASLDAIAGRKFRTNDGRVCRRRRQAVGDGAIPPAIYCVVRINLPSLHVA